MTVKIKSDKDGRKYSKSRELYHKTQSHLFLFNSRALEGMS